MDTMELSWREREMPVAARRVARRVVSERPVAVRRVERMAEKEEFKALVGWFGSLDAWLEASVGIQCFEEVNR